MTCLRHQPRNPDCEACCRAEAEAESLRAAIEKGDHDERLGAWLRHYYRSIRWGLQVLEQYEDAYTRGEV